MALPPPYPEIYEELMKGQVIPFLGAGAPLYARNPTKTPWMRRKQGQEEISYLPTARELADYLADRTQLPDSEKGELTKMAQYFEMVRGPQPLRQRLRQIFSYEQPPTPLHEFLADVPAPLLIVTTNYDDLMERAYAARDKPCDVVVHVTNDQENVLWIPHEGGGPRTLLAQDVDIDLDKVSVVYKIHGAIDRRDGEVGEYVITEDDYTQFLTRMTRKSVIPDIFAEPFQSRPFLFLGYGLYDWNLRVILNRIQEFRAYPRFRSWAIETLAKPVERKLWEARGVDVYDGLTLEQFLTELRKQGEDEPEADADGDAAGGGNG
jgi:hypothetical protein